MPFLMSIFNSLWQSSDKVSRSYPKGGGKMPPPLVDTKGGAQRINCAYTEGLFRGIMLGLYLPPDFIKLSNKVSP